MNAPAETGSGDGIETLILAPTPAFWLAPMVARLQRHGPVRVLAPWAWRQTLPGFTLQDPSRPFVAGTGASILGAPLEVRRLLARRLARGRASRLIAAELTIRRDFDRLVAATLRAWRPKGPARIVAPSLGGLRSFALAARRGWLGDLVEDLPDFATLNADLDRAARRFPDARSLTRFRAKASDIRQQQDMRGRVSKRWIRHPFTVQIAPERTGIPVARLPRAATSPLDHHPEPGRIVLAGPALARNGVHDALELVQSIPDLRLHVRPLDDWCEPTVFWGAAPTVCDDGMTPWERVVRAECVLAPTLSEAFLPEVHLAYAAGIPVVTTDRSAPWPTIGAGSTGAPERAPQPGAGSALRDALVAALQSHRSRTA